MEAGLGVRATWEMQARGEERGNIMQHLVGSQAHEDLAFYPQYHERISFKRQEEVVGSCIFKRSFWQLCGEQNWRGLRVGQESFSDSWVRGGTLDQVESIEMREWEGVH